jgi:bis(5'-nucleosyl)-tetraphosphatase (symmetrical)
MTPLPSPIAIGDLQGCFDSLRSLVKLLPSECPIWLTGDLVNRGPQSLETLRWVRANENRMTTVLGNHDLHLLAVACGVRRAHRSDTFNDILSAPDRDDLLDWLRQRPLAHTSHGWLMVHAGVLPSWSAEQTLELAAEVHEVLSGARWVEFMHQMYGNEPAQWTGSLQGAARLRVIVNALTRLRFCSAEGEMEFASKEGADSAPSGFMPWFEVPGRSSAGQPIVFGHWSTLGLINRKDLLAIDTGCVWGRQLTAVRLSDRQMWQVECA